MPGIVLSRVEGQPFDPAQGFALRISKGNDASNGVCVITTGALPPTTASGQLKIFSGSAHRALTEEIAEFLGVPVGHARLQRFPDTEVSFQIDENIRGTDVFVVQPTCADVDRHLVEMCVMIDAFRRSSASRITAVIPYYG